MKPCKDPCTEWIGPHSPEGYARRRGTHVHRVVYERIYGAIQDGYQVDHLCRNRGCINVDHMEAVTQKENILRGEGPCAKHARKTHCLRGHEFDGFRKTPSGVGRTCSKCLRLADEARRRRDREGL